MRRSDRGIRHAPQYIAASASRPCSMLFPDRMTIGRSTERPRSTSAAAIALTRASAVRGQPNPRAGPVACTGTPGRVRRRPVFESIRQPDRVGRQRPWRTRIESVAAAFDDRVTRQDPGLGHRSLQERSRSRSGTSFRAQAPPAEAPESSVRRNRVRTGGCGRKQRWRPTRSA